VTDPYAVLGLPPDAHEPDVNRVFRALARDLHPERYVGAPEEERAAAEERFKEVSAAYSAIKERREERRSWGPLKPENSLVLVMVAMLLTLGLVLAGVISTALTHMDQAEPEVQLSENALATISLMHDGVPVPHSAVLSVRRLGDYVVLQLDSNEVLAPGDLAASCIHDGAHAWRSDSIQQMSASYIVRYQVPLDADHEVGVPGGSSAGGGETLSFLYACDANYTPAPLAAALFAP